MADKTGTDSKNLSETKSAMRVDTAMVGKLAELLAANQLTEIEVEDGDRKIKVKREAAPAAAHSPAQAPSAAPAPIAAPGAIPDFLRQVKYIPDAGH